MNTRPFSLAAAVLALCATSESGLFAQGSAFVYQGVLNQGGAGVAEVCDLTFTLYSAASAGSAVGTSNVVQDLALTNGLFAVTLDFGPAAFSGAPRWLEVAARPGSSTGAYTKLLPRHPLTPTPYAIYSGGASAAGLNGQLTGGQIAPGSITGTHFASPVGVWNRTGTDLSYVGGNVGIGLVNPATRLQVAGEITATAVNITSDQAAKEEFKAVDPTEVLEKVVRLPISEWRYKAQLDARHLGPMAQDFHAAFGLGRDERHITTVDADGVALAAIQGLNRKLEDELQQKNRQIEELREAVGQLRKMLQSSAVANRVNEVHP